MSFLRRATVPTAIAALSLLPGRSFLLPHQADATIAAGSVPTGQSRSGYCLSVTPPPPVPGSGAVVCTPWAEAIAQ
ncbi:MAG: hypothetical protein QOG64_39 [Acidimicrobiaceae bacterium]|nr:hypothetical protein [Acidimicrobiaceae bacterium]